MDNVVMRFSVDKLEINLLERFDIPQFNENYILAHFAFSGDWGDEIKYAIFSTIAVDYHVEINADGYCQIPNIAMEQDGKLYVSVYGGNTKITNAVMVLITKSFYSDAPQPPLPPSYGTVRTPMESPCLYIRSREIDGKIVFEKSPDGVTWYVDEGKPGKDGENGEDGEDGYTPVRGTDYWTTADQQYIIQQVLAELPNGDEVAY